MARETRDKILEAATRVFAEVDSRGTSLRAIAREAGVNSALIQYHFRSREGLFEAAFLRALAPVEAQREEMLSSLRAGPTPSPTQLARLFVEPLLPLAGEEPERRATALRLVARALASDRGLTGDVTRRAFRDWTDGIDALIADALPALDLPTCRVRARLCFQTALETLAGPEMTLALAEGPATRDRLITDLVTFLAGGLSAAPAHLAPPAE